MKSDNLVKSLQRFGIQAAAYRRPPVGPDTFLLSIQPRSPEGVVTVNHGTADVEVFGSKARKQAAISVHEKGRKIVRKVRTDANWNMGKAPDLDVQKRLLRRAFPIIMPQNAKFTVKNVVCEERYRHPKTKEVPYWNITGEVTARVIRRTINNFLIGMDETHHFISPLPSKATSVKEAHKLLRPDVKRGSKRQGEWFFEPVSEKPLIRQLDNHADTVLFRRQGRFRIGNTTHIAMTHINLVHRRKGDRKKAKHLYVRGDIIDGRQGHHAVLFLDRWHRVVRNKETAMKVNRDQQEMAARQTRSFD